MLIGILLPDLRSGGAERISVNLANAFVRRGFSVDVVLMRAEGEFLPLLDRRVRVVDLDAPRLRDVLFPLVAYLRRVRPAGLISHMWPLTVLAPLAKLLAWGRAIVVCVEHNTWSVSERGHEKEFIRRVRLTTWFGYRLADAVVTVSSGAADEVAALARLPRDRVHVIYNPIVGDTSSEITSFGDLLPLAWSTGLHRKVLAVGALKIIKDFPTLLRAFAGLRQQMDAKLLILGEGEQRQQLDALVRSLGLEGAVFIPGFVGTTAPYFACADLLVLSSTGEGLPTVIVEALAQGTPVVSTDCPSGPREILEHGRYGALVPVGDPEPLAAAILESLQSTHDHDALRARAQDFSVDKAADAYLDLLLPDWRSRVRG